MAFSLRARAWRFILLMGFVSLFADMAYEGARGLAGPFLYSLGASAAVVGMVSGLGELVGYALRVVFGAWSQRTGRHWFFALVGYAVNLCAVPLLALATTWPVAAALLVCERLGKAVRSPSKDKLLSHAAAAVGHGKGFGFHEAMDQTGAVAGPLLGALGLAWWGYRGAFGVLVFPVLAALSVLAVGRFVFPKPEQLEIAATDKNAPDGKLPRVFWIYLAAAALLAFGYADFPLIAYHWRKASLLGAAQVPLAYAAAMGVDAVAALLFGIWFDRVGLKLLPLSALLAGAAVPLVFSTRLLFCGIGIVLWGLALGAQESTLKAGIAKQIPAGQRAGAYGIFHAAFGVAWFLGSAAMGWLYDWKRGAVVALAVTAQAAAALVFFWAGKAAATRFPAPA